ncbi:MAG: VacJ family lipoprotein [Alphaproteobacteria bacterium]
MPIVSSTAKKSKNLRASIFAFLLALLIAGALASPKGAVADDSTENTDKTDKNHAASFIIAQNQSDDDDDDDDDDLNDLFADGEDVTVSDPIEGLNRAFYKFNVGVDKVILTPASKVWQFIVPEPVDQIVGNFISNLELPLSAFNSLLQGDPRGTGITTMRFVTNSTIGFLGVADPASALGWYECEEDLGQTLGRYGVGNGPYLVVPFLGPSHLREFTSDFAEDTYLDPEILEHSLKEINASEQSRDNIGLTLTTIDIIQSRIEAQEIIDYVRETSVDEYAQVRTIYTQRSTGQVSESCSEIVDEQRLLAQSSQ